MRRAALLLCIATLAGCSVFEDEERLAGDRRPVRDTVAENAAFAPVQRALPPPREITEWTQTGGAPSHNSGHLAGPSTLTEAWRTDAGEGGSDDGVITGAPVVSGGRIFTLDAAAGLAAFDAGTGEALWESSLVPDENEDGEEGFGGGLATDGSRLFATTGFGEVLAIDPANGEIVWRTAVGAPFRAAPAVADGLVVAVTRASLALALDARTGQTVWRVQGVTADAALLGGASPALAAGGAILPFPSGELVAVEAGTGRRFWGAVITGGRRGLARAAITDLTGDPVVVGPLVIAANQSGRTVALDGRNGQRVWTRTVGATRPIWAAGDTLFMISDTAEALRLDARSGETLWRRVLPAFEDEEDREDPIAYSGPVLVGGRVVFTDSLGGLWSLDPQSGEGEAVAELPDGSVTGPVVAGGTVYVLTDDADLIAFR